MTVHPFASTQEKWDKAVADTRYWQKQLRLDGIDVELQVALPHQLSDDAQGRSATAPYHRFLILLRPECERTPLDNARFRLDWEVVIVHELLHLLESRWRDHPQVMKVLDEDDWLRRLHEDTLDATAEALVRARHGAQRQAEDNTHAH